MSTVYHAVIQSVTQLPLFVDSKVCAKCEKDKPLNQYRKWAKGVHGVRPRCAECEREYERARRQPYTREPEQIHHNPRHKFRNKQVQEGYKFCPACEQEKLLENFFVRNGKHKGSCKECIRERDRERNNLRTLRKKPIVPKATREGYKVCSDCLQEKPLGSFNKHSQISDGLLPRCKECQSKKWSEADEEEKQRRKAIRKASEDTRRDKIRAYDHKRKTTDAYRTMRRVRMAHKWTRMREIRRLKREWAKLQPPPKEIFCSCCKRVKPLNSLSLSKNRRYGRHSYCKQCCNEIASNEESLAKRRVYRQTRELDPQYRERRKQALDEWRHANMDKLREQSKLRYANDPIHVEMIAKSNRKWQLSHPMKMREYQMRRRSRLIYSTIGTVDYDLILKQYGMHCHICDQAILSHQTLNMDHVIPLARLGKHASDNIKPSHAICNYRKGYKLLEEMTAFDRRGPDPA